MNTRIIEERIKKESESLFRQIVLLGICYISLTVLFLGLLVVSVWGCGFLAFLPLYLFPADDTVGETKVIVSLIGYALLIILCCMPFIWCLFQIARHFILSLFIPAYTKDKNLLEVTKEDCPDFFVLISDIARQTGNEMPEHVYLSPEVNASVMYEHSGKFHISRSLVVGLGILQGMGLDELKSVIAHEFGHFSQKTKDVPFLLYRLSLVIRRMSELAQAYNRRTQIARSKSANNGKINSWYMANWPISFLTRKFWEGYRDVDARSINLLHLMEYEADAVACRIVGTRPFISSLYKLPILDERYEEYTRLIEALLSEKRSLSEYWAGYEYVFSKISDDTKLYLSCKDILTAEIGDNAHYPSRVKVMDGNYTHPSVKARIDNILQQKDAGKTIDSTDARTIVPAGIMDSVGRLKQITMAEDLQEPLLWSDVREISLTLFKAWADNIMKETYVPYFLVPFSSKIAGSFSIPLPEEEMQEHVETPFTAENREMLVEYNHCLEDYQRLRSLSDEESGGIRVMYNDKEYDCATALEEQKTYLESFEERTHKLDIDIYKFLWHRAKDKTRLNHEYWAMFYGYDNMCDFSDLMNEVNAVRGSKQSNSIDEKEIDIGDYLLSHLTRELWKYMRSFNYQSVYIVTHDWEGQDDSSIEQQLDKWYAFASTDIPPYTTAADIFKMTDEVNNLFHALYDYGRTCWTLRLIRAYHNIEEPEPTSPPPLPEH